MYRKALIAGCLFGLLGVVLGAMGAHAVKQLVPPERLALFVKASEYQFYHSFALIVCGVLYKEFPVRAFRTATLFFVLGILAFSGSLYGLTFVTADLKTLGPVNLITPLGGVFFILGWVMMLAGLFQKRNVDAAAA